MGTKALFSGSRHHVKDYLHEMIYEYHLFFFCTKHSLKKWGCYKKHNSSEQLTNIVKRYKNTATVQLLNEHRLKQITVGERTNQGRGSL